MSNESELKRVFDELQVLVKQIKPIPRDMEVAVLAGSEMVRNNAILAFKPFPADRKIPNSDISPHRRTSTLVRSLSAGPYIGSINEMKTTRTSSTIVIGSSLPYARRVEYGYMEKRDILGRLYHQIGRPYLGPAINNHRDEIRLEMAEAYGDALRNRLRRRS